MWLKQPSVLRKLQQQKKVVKVSYYVIINRVAPLVKRSSNANFTAWQNPPVDFMLKVL